jgi:hypothetical protein
MSVFVLKEPDAVFIHIPKTGGMSIRKGIWGQKYDGPYVGEWQDEWDDMFSFAFVRHPIDRFVSAFYMFTEGTDQIPRPKAMGMSLDQFAVAAMTNQDFHVTHGIAHHTIPMTNAFNMLDKARHIFRFERFEEDIMSVMAHLGVDDPWVPRYNVSQRYGNWQKTMKDMSPDTYAQLIDFYAEDFKEFGYEVPRLAHI